jgi:hypothetical protein
VIVDVEATTAVRQAEVGTAKTLLDRTAERLDEAFALGRRCGLRIGGDDRVAGGQRGAEDEFLLAATAQKLRKLMRLILFPGPILAT